MATTKVVTGHTVDAVRMNDDNSRYLIITVTYDDASTEVHELPIPHSA